MNYLNKLWDFIKARYAPRGARQAFAQYGEDLIIKDILKKKGIKEATYIDIGTHHPFFGNNTYLLYLRGGRGVLVEPNEEMCRVIKSKRPKDICLNVGAGKINGEADFYEFEQSTRSTFSKEQALENERETGQKSNIKKQKIISLNTIAEKYFKDRDISLISIDAEGLDFDVLSGFNFSQRPKVFCVEVSEDDKRVQNLLESKGYKLVAQVFQNAIFVDKN